MTIIRDRWRIGQRDRRADRQRAARALGRPLLTTQPIHHHSRGQIVVCESADYHALLHRRERVRRAGRDPNTHAMCPWCQSPRLSSGFRGNICEYCSLNKRFRRLMFNAGIFLCEIGDDLDCLEPTWCALPVRSPAQ